MTAPGMANIRIGFGEDAHALTPGRPLILGGTELPSPRGPDAHSDGDALLHALADALLSTFALGDIGLYFPPSDPAFKDMEGADIVRYSLQRLRARAPELEIVNLALVVTLDTPKLGPYREKMAARVAGLLGVPPERVGLGFKTSEGLAPDHVQVRATVLVRLLSG